MNQIESKIIFINKIEEIEKEAIKQNVSFPFHFIIKNFKDLIEGSSSDLEVNKIAMDLKILEEDLKLYKAHKIYINYSLIPSIQRNIFEGDIEALKQSLISFPFFCFEREAQLSILNLAYKHYSKEMVDVLQKSLCCDVEKIFPIINHYKSLPRALNARHLKKYRAEEEKQAIYHEQQKENVKFALLAIKDTTCSFESLLENLGHRRRHTDVMTSEHALEKGKIDLNWTNSKFGIKREEGGLFIPTTGAYEAYESRLWLTPSISISFQGEIYQLKIVKFTKVLEKGKVFIKPRLCSSYRNFWKKGDPVFAYAESLYCKIAKQTFDDPEELKRLIATFHWLLSNCPPFERGSASILEVLTDAMWLAHGYLPQPIEAGKSLDLEALCMPNPEDFIKIYPMGVKLVTVGIPHLESHDLSWSREQTAADRQALVQISPKLTNLTLSGGGKKLTDADLQVIAQSCFNLTSLDLSGCVNVTRVGLQAIVQNCPNLTSLNLSSCDHLMDDGLQAILQSCPNLTSLNLSDCNNLTNEGLKAIAQSCPNLNSLNLSFLYNLTDECLQALVQSCHSLTSLEVYFCNNLTEDGLQIIAQSCPQLEIKRF